MGKRLTSYTVLIKNVMTVSGKTRHRFCLSLGQDYQLDAY